jgi:hypothetical protein
MFLISSVILARLEIRAFIQCVRKVAVHLLKLLEVMSTNVYTGLNPFKFYSQTRSADLNSKGRCALIKGVGSDVHEGSILTNTSTCCSLKCTASFRTHSILCAVKIVSSKVTK